MTTSPIPRLMREGFIPTTSPKGWRRSDMLIPKKTSADLRQFQPYRERLAGEVLAALIETAHLEGVDRDKGGVAIITLEVTPRLLEQLFAFDTDVEDREPDPPEKDGDEEDYMASEEAASDRPMTWAEARHARREGRRLVEQAVRLAGRTLS